MIYNGIDVRGLASRRRSRAARDRSGVDAVASVGRVRGPHHAAEGPAVLPARGRAAAPRGAARPLRRCARHPADHGRGRGARREAAGRRATAWCGSIGCCRATSSARSSSAATTFVCPSVYEPLGIVNLEAMACGAAVVGTATGGIPEVVVDGVTGRLVPIEQVQDGTGTPIDPDRFVADLARGADRGRQRSGAGAGVRQGGARARDRATSAGRASPTQTARALRGGGRRRPIGWAACRRCSNSPTSSSAETPATSSTTSTGRSATTSAG